MNIHAGLGSGPERLLRTDEQPIRVAFKNREELGAIGARAGAPLDRSAGLLVGFNPRARSGENGGERIRRIARMLARRSMRERRLRRPRNGFSTTPI